MKISGQFSGLLPKFSTGILFFGAAGGVRAGLPPNQKLKSGATGQSPVRALLKLSSSQSVREATSGTGGWGMTWDETHQSDSLVVVGGVGQPGDAHLPIPIRHSPMSNVQCHRRHAG